MELCCTGWSFPRCSLEEAAGIGRALGFGAMDWGAYPGGHLDRTAVLNNAGPELSRLAATGLKTANIYWTFGDGFADRPLNSADRTLRGQNCEDFKRVVDFCHRAGVPSVMLLPGIQVKGQTREQAIELCVEACGELMEISRPAGVAIALEAHVGSILESPEQALSVVAEIGNAGLALDYGHFVTLGYTQAAVDPLCPYAVHVHMRQGKPGALQTRLEYGTLNFPAMVDTLRQAGYQGYVAIEYVHQDYLQTDNVDVVSETVKLRNLLQAYL